MPIVSGKYVAPNWINGEAPEISAQNLQDISDTLECVPIGNGGTGATTVGGARANLGLGNSSGPIPVSAGGTGATTIEGAKTNLNITPAGIGALPNNVPVPIDKGGTNATTAANARRNLGFGTNGALPISLGGTGATTAEEARANIGLGSGSGALGIANGGTGATTAKNARINLGFNSQGVLPLSLGGTNAADGATGLKNLFAAGPTVLSSYQYGDTLPETGVEGQLFFKKL